MSVQNSADPPMVLRDARAGGLGRANRSFTDLLGHVAEDLTEKPLLDWIEPEDRPRVQALLDEGVGTTRARHLARSGRSVAFLWRVRMEESGPVVLGTWHDETRATSDPARLPGPKRQDTMAVMLQAMSLLIEEEHPGMKCSVLLLDADGKRIHVGAGPSLPDAYNAEVEGLVIGPGVGSCGTATYWNEPIIVEDIHRDPLWTDLRDAAADAGVAACWSYPITTGDGEVLGATALYNPTPRAPTRQELKGLRRAARMFGLAIERVRAEEALQQSEEGARLESRLLSAVTAIVTSFVDTGDWKKTGADLVRAVLDLTESEYGFLGEVHSGELRVLAHQGVVWSENETRALYRDALKSYARDGYVVFPQLDTLFGHVITSGEPVLTNDASSDSRAANRLPPGHPELRSFLGAPIINGGKVVAMLGVANAKSGFSSDDIRTAEFLCGAGSVVFDHHRRHEREASLEDRLRQAAKMEALGVMAGGLAHDFNNVLTAILGSAELALDMAPPASESRRFLDNIVTASTGATELCNQMLAYAGRGALSMQPLECNELVAEFGGLLNVTLSKKATIAYELAERPLVVEADKAQLGQVLMNLVANAADALGDVSGRILVKTDSRSFRRGELDRLQPNASLPEGEYVWLSVEDSGCGMNSTTQEKIFDPFFTTKFSGRGLGLAAVQGIVLRHRGGIGLESQPGTGTTFTVVLPRSSQPVLSRRALPAQTLSTDPSKRVLVVDDEPRVREVLKKVLESGGFEIVLAENGRKAIEIFESEHASIDAVLLDLSMPELDGEETFKALRAIHADTPVVLSSGFTEQETLNRFEGTGFAGVLQKPTPKRVLIAKIREVVK